MQSVAGYIPDISLLKDSRPVRCIEVTVTTPVSAQKLAAIQNLGVEVVQVPVRNEDELRAIYSSKGADKTWWWAKFSAEEESIKSVRLNSGVNWQATRQYRILEGQKQADQAVNALMGNLFRCSPEVRRAFVALLNDISGLGSLYPLPKDNPKYAALYPDDGD